MQCNSLNQTTILFGLNCQYMYALLSHKFCRKEIKLIEVSKKLYIEIGWTPIEHLLNNCGDKTKQI